MRGSVAHQVHRVFSSIIKTGESKHEAKAEARSDGAKTWHEIGKNLYIYSYKTADAYRDVAKQAFEYIREEFGVKDIEKLSQEHIEAFLEHKIEEGVKYSTMQQYMAAIEKLEVTLNRYAEQHNTGKEYSFNLQDIRQEAQAVLEKSDVHRAYSDPKSLVENIDKQDFKTIATAQYESGARIHELNHLKLEQFRPDNKIEVQGKGGKIRELQLTETTYNALKSLVEQQGGKLIFDTNTYRAELRNAAEKSGQEYNGSHGLRWNFSQERFAELQEKGLSYEQALSEVSKELGHNRPDITEHYLR